MFYFIPFKDSLKSLPCPLPVACVENQKFQDVSTGVGLLVVPVRDGEIWCTGTLVTDSNHSTNNYFITAHHCFDEEKVNWEDLEVFWDFRCEDCEGSKCPSLDNCPRSEGAKDLAYSECLDAHLIKLYDVPVGSYGRAYVGWDTSELSKNMTLYSAHHPQGTLMKSAIGKITDTDLKMQRDSFSATYHAIEVLWNEGITNFGSSGSGVFCENLNFRLVGMLSGGPQHNCYDRSHNYDYLASFRHFFPLIKCYLVPGEECVETADCEGGCLFKSLVYPDVSSLNFFRSVRSLILKYIPYGERIVQFYYKNSSDWVMKLDNSPELKQFLRRILSFQN